MTLSEDLAVAAADAVALENSLTIAEDLLDVAKAEIADLQQQLADCQGTTPEPPPLPTTTDFGACATKGGSPNNIATKWGAGAAARTFATSGFSAVSRPTNVGTWHHSWKPAIGTQMSGASVQAACANMQAGDHVEVWHEADVKFNNGSLTSSQCQQVKDMKNWFFDAIQSVRPDLKVALTFGAWIFDDRSNKFPGTAGDPAESEYWSDVKADVIGIDCDGYQSTTTYPDFTSCVKNVKSYIAGHGFKGWAVPEFIHPRLSSDSSGSQRAAFLTSNGQKFRDGGAVYVTLFDYNYRPNQEVLAGSPEFAAWKAFI